MADYSLAFFRAISLYIIKNMVENPSWQDNILSSGILVTNADLGRSFKEMGGKRTEVPFFTRTRHKADDPVYAKEGNVLTEHTLDSSSFIGVLKSFRLKYNLRDEDINIVDGKINLNAQILRAIQDDRVYNNLDILLAVLEGALASPSMKEHTLNETATDLTKVNIIDVLANAPRKVLGDKHATLNTIMAHSAIVNEVVAKNRQSMANITPAANQSIALPSLFGFNFIENDDLPYNSTTKEGRCIMLGQGSLFGAEGRETSPSETKRDQDKETTSTYVRWNTCVHPAGMSYTGGAEVKKFYPTLEDLANGGNWDMVWDSKNVPIVAVDVKLGTPTPASASAQNKKPDTV